MNIEESKAPTPEATTVGYDDSFLGIAKQHFIASKNLRRAMKNLQRSVQLEVWPFDSAKLDSLLMQVSMSCAEMATHSEICKLHYKGPPGDWTKRRGKKTASHRRSGGEPKQNR